MMPETAATMEVGVTLACIMAAESYWTGKKLYWDSAKEEILDHAPQAM